MDSSISYPKSGWPFADQAKNWACVEIAICAVNNKQAAPGTDRLFYI